MTAPMQPGQPNDPLPPNWAGPLPNNWTGGESITKFWRGKWLHLYSLRKQCAQCQGTMTIAVTRAALEGTAKNAGLHLKRCAACRDANKRLNTHSRPYVEGQEQRLAAQAAAPDPAAMMELETLRATNATMKAELDGLYEVVRDLRKRLAQYELQPAMEAMAANHKTQKLPWEG